ncbi:hypothetical protein ODJ79_23495 [Actinoplanes sp. KI2]|uniref:hypothetical protein n=1 Tax=Actinoplanes sp. KI2 TaxID=2983315 RepID=UPI0021D614BD|nr:hypothetical protein [Actinoplanes sp. KI2]MCU7726706.1 hypothetical protein [Actinoplanes sp. KI2]
MLDTGGGGGGTPWESMTLDLMQRLIQNPDVEAQWQLVEAWNKSAQLLGDHLYQMQEYRNNLAAVWPPQKSAAAAAYLDRLDVLIRSLNETYEASIANQRALFVATGSIDQAQAQMHKIYQEYESNKAALEAFAANSQQTGATSGPSNVAPPVAPSRQEELRLQAVKLLSGVSTDLAESQAQVIKPTPYKTITERGDITTPATGGQFVAPPIPPIVPRPAARNAPTAPSDAEKMLPSSAAASKAGGLPPGLVLGGIDQPVLPPPSTAGVGSLESPLPGVAGGPQSNRGFPPPSAGVFPGIGSPVPPTGPGPGRPVDVPHEGVTRAGIRIPGGATRARTPSGFIGGFPGGVSSQSGSGRITSRRINPVGGLIGEGGRALRSRHGAGEQSGGLYGTGVGQRQGHRQDEERPRWDPTNPWEITEGVDPIVLPPRERRIDPGPLIGLD